MTEVSHRPQIWQMPKNDEVTIEQREQVLTPVRVVSVFAEQLGNKTDQDDNQSQPLDLDREVTTRSKVSYTNAHHYTNAALYF